MGEDREVAEAGAAVDRIQVGRAGGSHQIERDQPAILRRAVDVADVDEVGPGPRRVPGDDGVG